MREDHPGLFARREELRRASSPSVATRAAASLRLRLYHAPLAMLAAAHLLPPLSRLRAVSWPPARRASSPVPHPPPEVGQQPTS
jgi:hypothetical protein